jgi:hypothetical protein
MEFSESCLLSLEFPLEYPVQNSFINRSIELFWKVVENFGNNSSLTIIVATIITALPTIAGAHPLLY